MWRDRWWRMFDRDPIMTWVHGRIALLGDAAHPPLQYIAQGAIMAIEDGYVLAEHLSRCRDGAGVDGYRPRRLRGRRAPSTAGGSCSTSRAWGDLWHLDGTKRRQRNALLRARDTCDYAFTDWLYSTTALTPGEEPAPFRPIPLDPAEPRPVSVA